MPDDIAPSSYRAAMNSPEAAEWRKAVRAELATLLTERRCWRYVPYPPKGTPILRCHFVFKKKKHLGQIVRFKARLVVDGSGQKQGVNFSETFAPVVKYATFRVFCAICALHGLSIHQLDVKNAFIYASLAEVVYMYAHEEMNAPPGMVCLLLRSLYGLKQAPRNWNGHLHDFIMELGFRQTLQDACLYVHTIDGHIVFMAVFVDDILLASRSDRVLTKVKAAFQARFEMTDEGLAQEFLGVRICQGTGQVYLDQQHYCETIVRDFANYIGSRNYSEVPMQANAELYVAHDPSPDQAAWVARFPYATIVGKIVYLTAITRPDIAFAVSMLSRFMAQPTYRACMAVTRLLNYLSRTPHYGLVYHGESLDMHAYSDSDWATCPVTRRSVSGTLVFMCGAPVSWMSRRQQIVATSSMEAEYIAAYYAAQDVVWFRALLQDLDLQDPDRPTPLRIDNQSARSLAHNPVHHARSKHIDVKFHWLREQVLAGVITLEYVGTDEQKADVLTKPKTGDAFHRNAMQLVTSIHSA